MWRDDNHIEVAPKGIDTESMTTNMYLGMHVIWANNGEIPSPFCQTRAPGQCFTGRLASAPTNIFFVPSLFVRAGFTSAATLLPATASTLSASMGLPDQTASERCSCASLLLPTVFPSGSASHRPR